MARVSKKEPGLLKWLPVVAMCVAGISGVIAWTSWLTSNVARTTTVDDLFKNQNKYIEALNDKTIKYTDERIATVRTESFAHSDFNRSEMSAEYKGLSVKLDMLILMMGQQNPRHSKP